MTVAMTANETVQGWVYLVLELLLLPQLLLPLEQHFPQQGRMAWVNLCYYAINFAACALIFRGFLGKNLANAGRAGMKMLSACLMGFGGHMLGNLTVSAAIGLISPDFSNINDGAILALARENFWAMAVGVVLLVPLAEECLFRGLLFRGSYGYGRFAAYGISTVCFCALHILGYVGSYPTQTLLLCALQYVPAGLSLAWAYEKTDSIFAPILIHTAVNAVTLYALR